MFLAMVCRVFVENLLLEKSLYVVDKGPGLCPRMRRHSLTQPTFQTMSYSEFSWTGRCSSIHITPALTKSIRPVGVVSKVSQTGTRERGQDRC